ncbi:uncharacterized protein LOC141640496 [Silene latifolia]|uniref:uncharacterized protein LOC141640496 n=1 Tax=Silene latifolia TaxID=37657 RepID=UPI003D779A2C
MWDDLHDHFGVVDGSRIQQLKSALRDCRQTEDMSVAVYYGKLCQLWGELDSHEPIITCDCCDKCTSGTQYAARRASDRLHQFLLGLLPTPYSSLRSVILAQVPLPSVARAFNMISQEERVRGIDRTNDTSTDVSTFNVKPRFDSRQPPKDPSQMTRTERQQLRCNNYEIPEWWYELKGIKPPGSRGNKAGRGRGGGRSGSSRSRDEGNGRGEGKSNSAANTVNVAPPATDEYTPNASASRVTVYGTPTHTHSTHSGKWLLDTGCSYHVTGNFALLTNVQNIPSKVVGLPDGSTVSASKLGRVVLTRNLCLDSVLFVPQLQCNLISASQLCDALNCEFITNATTCIIQDQGTKAMIGMVERHDGLYYLRTDDDN